ncbi:MAG: hypothetical protein U0Q12_01065 [Vicinamibacterales bacterium]
MAATASGTPSQPSSRRGQAFGWRRASSSTCMPSAFGSLEVDDERRRTREAAQPTRGLGGVGGLGDGEALGRE